MKSIILVLVLIFIGIDSFVHAQEISGRAVTKTADTIFFRYDQPEINKFTLNRGVTGYLANGARVNITLKKHKQFTLDTLVFEAVRIPGEFRLFMQRETKGKLTLYVHRFIMNMHDFSKMGVQIHYYLKEENGTLTRIRPRPLRKTPELYFKAYPSVLKTLTGKKADWDNLPKIITKFNKDHL